MDLADLRRSYVKGGLTEAEAPHDPFELFALWFDQVHTSGNPEPNAMALATATVSGLPNVRMVLLKAVDVGRGFIFYTNYESRKASELAENAHAALLFYWPELERQVRIQGSVEVISREESEQYFRSRPIGHQLGAWASKQSSIVQGRDALEQQMAEAAERFQGLEQIPLPPFWGGYCVRPAVFEFWQGRSNRLHDRLEYARAAGAGAPGWDRRRLSP